MLKSNIIKTDFISARDKSASLPGFSCILRVNAFNRDRIIKGAQDLYPQHHFRKLIKQIRVTTFREIFRNKEWRPHRRTERRQARFNELEAGIEKCRVRLHRRDEHTLILLRRVIELAVEGLVINNGDVLMRRAFESCNASA